MEDALTSLLWALVFFVFLISNVITGLVMYKLGLHGRVFKMMDSTVPKIKEVPEEKEPLRKPGAQYDPFYRYEPRRPDDEDLDEDVDIDEGFVEDPLDEDNFEEAPDPVVPYPRKAKVVMTKDGY